MAPFAIELRPAGDDKCTVIYPDPITKIDDKENIAALRKITDKEPYNLPAVLELARQLFETGEIEQACRVRFEGCQQALEALPEGTDIQSVDWDNSESNQAFITIFGASGLDFYHFGDFEMAAGLFEITLDIDIEDHYQVTPLLGYCYIMIEEWELLDEVMFDIPRESMDYELICALIQYKKEGEISTKNLSPEIIAELSATDHPEIPIHEGPVHKDEQARMLWFRAQPILLSLPGFITASIVRS